MDARASGPALVVERAALAVPGLRDVRESHVDVSARQVRPRVEGLIRGQPQGNIAARGGHVDGLQTGAVEAQTQEASAENSSTSA
jgi:hypothetical protein